jgi:hypothetical protein
MTTDTWSPKTALVAGASASAATTVTVALAGLAETGSAWPAVNAISKMVHGNHAPWREEVSWKFTGTGALLNTVAVFSWATVYAMLRGPRTRTDYARAVTAGVATSALAYVVDYHVVPDRFTPGFEKRLPDRSLGLIYTVLALGLAASELAAPDQVPDRQAAAPRMRPRRVDRLDDLRRTMGVREIR